MYRATVLTPWAVTADGGSAPLLTTVPGLLVAGDSAQDVTGTPAANLPCSPNYAVWEVVCAETTLDTIGADNRFEIIEWEEVVNDAIEP